MRKRDVVHWLWLACLWLAGFGLGRLLFLAVVWQ